MLCGIFDFKNLLKFEMTVWEWKERLKSLRRNK